MGLGFFFGEGGLVLVFGVLLLFSGGFCCFGFVGFLWVVLGCGVFLGFFSKLIFNSRLTECELECTHYTDIPIISKSLVLIPQIKLKVSHTAKTW